MLTDTGAVGKQICVCHEMTVTGGGGAGGNKDTSRVSASACLGCCCLLLASRPSNTLVYLRDGSAQTIVRAATLR